MVRADVDASGGKPIRDTSLQQVGFTTSMRHRTELWALTPLISPLLQFLKTRAV